MVSLTKSTRSPVNSGESKKEWCLFDAKNQILGRLATKIATTLIGKDKTSYVSHLDEGSYVVVINAKDIRLTGKKEKNKTYTRYSGYPGGLKKITFSKLKEKNPEEVIRHAVYGMLPKNKLRDKRIAGLHIYKNSEHPFKVKFEALSTKSEIISKSKTQKT